MRKLAIVALALSLPVKIVAGVVLVPGDAPTIQQGLDMSASGDTVLVAPGVYTGPLNRDLDFHGKSTVLSSAAGPEATVIDCESLGRALIARSDEDTTSVVRGFTIANGAASTGSAIYVLDGSGLKIEDCVITGCSAGKSNATLQLDTYDYMTHYTVVRRCAFADNDCTAIRVYDCPFLLADSTFSGNRTLGAPALNIDSCEWWSVSDCLFESNYATGMSGAAYVTSHVHRRAGQISGQNVSSSDLVTPGFSRCVFRDNSAEILAGALRASVGGFSVSDCLFIGNSAPMGGAIYDEDGLHSVSGCVFYGNSAESGGAFYENAWGPSEFHHCTFVANSATAGPAISGYFGSRVFSQLVIAFSSGGPPVDCQGSKPTFRHVVTFANAGGDELCGTVDGILHDDPLFCSIPAEDFTLCANSPCLPANNVWGELIGALGEGCGECVTAIDATTWGAIKAKFK